MAAALVLAACGSQDSQGPDALPGVVSLQPGESAPVAGTSTLKLQGGSEGSEHVLVVTDTSTANVSAKHAYQISATGLAAPGTVSAPATTRIPGAAGPSSAAGRPDGAGPALDVSFSARVNARARPRLLGGFRAARAARAATSTAAVSGGGRSLSRAIVDPNVGDLFPLNVGSRACDSVVTRTARVAAIGTRAIVLADVANPSGGFSTADYQRFAARFDTLVYPLDVSNFGTPADIDQNRKILLFFTSAVNALTPRNSESYVGGFFFDRDLFPVVGTAEFEGCAGSNFGELFYLLTPDPTGAVNGNRRSTGFVDSSTTSVIAHEFQHLINSSRRLFVTNADDFEAVWLNEGLSHIAEELLFYRESKLAPRSNIDGTALRSSAAASAAYNADMSSNTSRFSLYLEEPSGNSPMLTDDSLATRGATWNFLRYAADRKLAGGGNESAVWQSLSGGPARGAANLRAVFGSDIGGWLRDWNVSHYTDDLVPSVVAAHRQPSWNFRSVFPALSGGPAYPLKVLPLAPTGQSGSLVGGAAAYYRFSVPAGTTAEITVTAPAPIDTRIVRVR